jgi:UDP-N-acetyl-D-glucosamine dehydrogenase
VPSRPESKLALLERLEVHRARVAVVGLGYVGLPLATSIAASGHFVTGIERAPDRVDAINGGRSYIPDVPSSEIAQLVALGRLTATTDAAAAGDADVVVIAVPTPIDQYRIPDMTFVRSAAEAVIKAVTPGTLVVLESTTYPGTTEEVLLPLIRQRGLIPGTDVFVGYSPERIDPGNQTWNVTNTPKVVSGLTQDCLELTIAFYGSFVEQLVPVTNLKTAEITKLFENIFRIVNIALVNEFQVICDSFGIDVWEVIEACSTKPYGFMPFYPGPGLGGHCVPVDPFYLAWKAREKSVNTEFIELAGRINAAMPVYIVSKIAAVLNGAGKSLRGSRVALLGVAYKKNTSDIRESPAIRLIELLNERGAVVTYHDPHVAVMRSNGHELRSQALTADYLTGQDCAVVVADHDAIDWTLVLGYAPKVVDTRNALGRLVPQKSARVTRAAARE